MNVILTPKEKKRIERLEKFHGLKFKSVSYFKVGDRIIKDYEFEALDDSYLSQLLEMIYGGKKKKEKA